MALAEYAQGTFSCVTNGAHRVERTDHALSWRFSSCPHRHNNDIPPKLHLRKVVVNDNGGTATVADFTLTANGTGSNDLSGTSPVDSGSDPAGDTWALSETHVAGYTASAWVCVGGTQGDADHITVGVAGEATCTITNDDQPGHIIIRKITDPLGSPTSFDFDATGSSYADFSLTGQSGSNENSQTLDAGTTRPRRSTSRPAGC